MNKQLFLVVLLIFLSSQSESDDMRVEISSGPRKIALLELFTSEGCSSCPPADQWLSELKTDPGLWTSYAPIAFHVDYWDYIGWSDRFARPEFSNRQQRYALEGATRFVYTPGFFVSGMEWQGWRTNRPVVERFENVGDLSISVSGENITARFESRRDEYGELLLHVAVLGMNLESQVTAGENTRKTLHHDFVALGVASLPLDRTATGYEANTQLPDVGENTGDRAIVAWVTSTDAQTPIQTVGGSLPLR